MKFQLPQPNEHGDYWLEKTIEVGERAGIFQSKILRRQATDQSEAVVEATGTYYATRGMSRGGYFFDGGDLRRFANPREALAVINGELP